MRVANEAGSYKDDMNSSLKLIAQCLIDRCPEWARPEDGDVRIPEGVSAQDITALVKAGLVVRITRTRLSLTAAGWREVK